MARGREANTAGGDRMIQGRIWTERLPRREVPVEDTAERYEWFSKLHPALFDQRRYNGHTPEDVGKSCVVCLMDTRDTDVQRCPRCRRRLIWVAFEPLPY